MILRVTIHNIATVSMDDGTKGRPVPEVVDDYLTRLRQQAEAVWRMLPENADAVGQE